MWSECTLEGGCGIFYLSARLCVAMWFFYINVVDLGESSFRLFFVNIPWKVGVEFFILARAKVLVLEFRPN